jgi:crotonobetainyl-CoA:carnitine CoA-transferase CaiB-like acyl-CoA transferase
MAALGIVLALHAREQTGRGQFIDASLYGAQLFLAAPTLQAFLATGSERFAAQQSRTRPQNPLWNTYPTGDRWVFLCVENTDTEWSRLRRSLDDDPALADPRFASTEDRRRHAAELVSALDRLLRRRTAAEWIERWRAAGITASRICDFSDLAADPQAWENGYFLEAYCEEVQRTVEIRGLPVGLGKTPGTVRSLGPELGQHTEEILVDTLGYSWEQVGAFKEQGVIL